VFQAYRYALDPTPRQRRALSSHAGASRFAYNWALEHVRQCMEAKAAGEDIQVPWTLFELRRAWNRAKHEVAPWWAQNSKEAYTSGLDGLARALKNWQESKQGRRAGPRMGFPKRKRKGKGTESCRFTTGAIRLKNRRLAGRLADASLGELRRQLAYKSVWAGTALVEAGRFFPSSKICSGCGHVKAKLPLYEREHRCEHCGMALDRDLNAARNLAALVASTMNGVAGSGPETGNARGWGQDLPFGGMSSMKREAGTKSWTRVRPAPPTGNGRLPDADRSLR
jgi:transposase